VAYYLNIKSPVKDGDKEAFRLVSLDGHEEMSRLFSFTLGLESQRKDIKPDEIIGKPITFSVLGAQGQPRYFHGCVSRFNAGGGEPGFRSYEAEVVPWLWFLTRTADCRIFAKKKVPQILEEIFKDLKIPHPVKTKLKRDYGEWEYCVQYRETDFNFVSRLMEQEGIFYYFEHSDGQHVLVLGDSPEHYGSQSPPVQYEYSFAGEGQVGRITAWQHQYEFIPGKYAQTDYNFAEHPPGEEETPAKLLLATSPAKDKPPTIDPETYEIFNYPGEYEDKNQGKVDTDICMEQEEVPYNVVSGVGLCEFFSPGGKFKLEKHPAAAENDEYVLLSVRHSATDTPEGRGPGQTYTNHFTCMPAKVPFHPALLSPKPSIYGVQTAVVVGPKGKEINADEYGRVQVQFFWDRRGSRLQKKQEEPCWIRVGQLIAGKQWGAMFIPRIGQEVMVTFLEGDPDRPLVTGVVYNKDQKPPYNPKEEPTKSYIKTNSSLGGEGFNEIRFEDKKGKEQVFVHGERDMDVRVKNESRTRVGANSHEIIGWEKDGQKGGDQRLLVYKDQHATVHGNRAEWVQGSSHLQVGKDGESHERNIIIHGKKWELIDEDSHLHVKKSRNEEVDGSQSLTVGCDQQEKVGMKHALDAGMEIHLKSGMKVVIEAGVQLTLKGPGGFIDISPAGVAIQGTMVLINSGGAPGVGSGSSPAAAEDAITPTPLEPDQADDAKSGQKSTPYG